MSTGLIWRLSPWDLQVHAFRALGEVTSEALCGHSALTSRLEEPADYHRRCLACLLLHGDELADKTGNRVWAD